MLSPPSNHHISGIANHQKKSSIFGNIINIIRGTPRMTTFANNKKSSNKLGIFGNNESPENLNQLVLTTKLEMPVFLIS